MDERAVRWRGSDDVEPAASQTVGDGGGHRDGGSSPRPRLCQPGGRRHSTDAPPRGQPPKDFRSRPRSVPQEKAHYRPPAAAALLTGADGILLAVVRLRRVCPQQRCRPTCSEPTPSPSARPSRRPDTLAGLFDVSRRTLRNAIRDVRPVLDARHLVITPAGTGTPRQPICPARPAGHLPETTQTLPAAGMSIPDGCRRSGITGPGTAGRQLADRTRSCAAAAIW